MAEKFMNQTEIEYKLEELGAKMQVEMDALFSSVSVTGLDGHCVEEKQIGDKHRPEYERLYRLLEKAKTGNVRENEDGSDFLETLEKI